MPVSRRLLLCALLLICLSLPAFVAGAEAESTDSREVVAQDCRTMVDFTYLQALNPDCVGWLYQESSGISQPVMYSADGEVYAERLFDGAVIPNRQRGCVFVDSQGDPTFSSDYTLLRASVSDTGPFAWLASYADQEYYQQHRAFRLLTPAGDWQAEVFAYVYGKRGSLPSVYPTGDRAEWLHSLRVLSPLRVGVQALPLKTEPILALTGLAESNNCHLLLCTLRPIRYENDVTVDLTKQPMDQMETQSGRVKVGTLGERYYYAQNDSIWNRSSFESGVRASYRPFGDGGCGPTVVAMAIANLVPTDRLPYLGSMAADPLGYQLCPCSVNRLNCSHLHVPYHPTAAREYLRYLPMIIGDFAAGNNRWGALGRSTTKWGTSMSYLPYLCDVFRLKQEAVRGLEGALDYLEEHPDAVCIASCTGGSPFTTQSHYVLIVGVDDTYFYVLDPLRRESYDGVDRLELAEILTPGVARIRRESADHCNTYPYVILQPDD